MYLSGKKQPETAEKLMRSRYTAFYRGNLDYLIATLHPERRKPDDREELINSIKNIQWLGLTIIDTQPGKKNDKIAYVEFEAIYQIKEPGQLHERSKFVKIGDRWFYVTGEILLGIIPETNQPCWCRSGKKFLKCHGN